MARFVCRSLVLLITEPTDLKTLQAAKEALSRKQGKRGKAGHQWQCSVGSQRCYTAAQKQQRVGSEQLGGVQEAPAMTEDMLMEQQAALAALGKPIYHTVCRSSLHSQQSSVAEMLDGECMVLIHAGCML